MSFENTTDGREQRSTRQRRFLFGLTKEGLFLTRSTVSRIPRRSIRRLEQRCGLQLPGVHHRWPEWCGGW